jgi:outer membrane protein assembly factor BamD (BamD/ComL family)
MRTALAMRIGMIGVSFVWVTGCRTLAGPQETTAPSLIRQTSGESDSSADNRVTQAVAEEPSLTERTKKTSTQLMNLLTGRELENLQRAKELYQEGDNLFKQAANQPRDEAKASFARAAKLFGRAGEAAPGTALQQDAMYMQAESLFFADRLVDATDVYEKLQKEFPRNRHIDRVAARLFSISRYWIEVSEAEKGNWFPINLTDPKRPRTDLDGHAIRVLDQIRYDDPTGRLADDATMAAAAEYIRQEKFQEADEFLTDLRETFSDSEHLFLAHLLGINVKLETYRGPKYSGLVLEEAEKLVKQTRQRFPDKLSQKDYGERLEKAASQIAFLQAERLRYRAEYREKRREYGAARYYYNLLLQRFPDTPHADTARDRLAATESYPEVPPQRLSWLTTIFPDSTATGAPLELTEPVEDEPPKTMLR